MDDLPQGIKTIITTLTQRPHLETSTRCIKPQQRVINSLKSVIQSRTMQENPYFLCYNIRQLYIKIKSYQRAFILLEINP